MPGGLHEHMKPWEPEEDRLIIELLATLGPKWSKIVKALPGRSISSIRNRWQRIEKGRKLQEEGKIFKNRCPVCGQPKRGHVCFAKLREKAAAEDDTLAEVLPDVSDLQQSDDDEVESALLASETEEASRSSAPATSQAEDENTVPIADDDFFDSLEERIFSNLPLDDAENEPVPAPIARIKSGERICGELGFGAVPNVTALSEARVNLVETDEIITPMVLPYRDCSKRSARSESEVVLPSRAPSLAYAEGHGGRAHRVQRVQ